MPAVATTIAATAAAAVAAAAALICAPTDRSTELPSRNLVLGWNFLSFF